MNKKKSFLLLFLFFFQTNCMKRSREIIEFSSSSLSAAKPKTIQELKEKHKKQYLCFKKTQIGAMYIHYPHNEPLWSLILQSNKRTFKKDQFNIICNGYSLLGIALLSQKKIHLNVTTNTINYHAIIKKLIDLDFHPTQSDKELALLIQYKKCAPIIIQTICTFQHSPFTIKAPKEIIHYISLLMFESEKLLF